MKVPCEDIAKLVGEDRKYDLLVMGLQEAPRNNICKLLKNTLADTHMYVYLSIFDLFISYFFYEKFKLYILIVIIFDIFALSTCTK